MATMQYNNNTGNYEATEDGHRIEVDGDVFQETLQEMEKDGMSWEAAMDELLNTTTWTGSTPMHGVSIDGVEQEAAKNMQVRTKSIAANVASVNRELGGSHRPLYGGIVPGMEEERVREVVQVVIELAPGTLQEGDEYILPNGLRTKIDRNGTFCKAEYAE